MFIAKNNDLIILVKETREELEFALQLMNYTSIEETEINYIFYNGQYLTEEEITEKEQERIALLNLTGADVERGIFRAKGMDFDDILNYLSVNPIDGLNIKALKIEFKANNFYRGNPYVGAVGKFLGFTEKQLDNFFEYNDYLYLTNCTLSINATPTEAIIKINGIEQNTITVPYKTEVECEVSCEGYVTQTFNIILEEDTIKEIVLEGITETE